jgi:hypothetical protein
MRAVSPKKARWARSAENARLFKQYGDADVQITQRS